MKIPTARDHYEAYLKSPRKVFVRGKYIHEVLHKASEFPSGTEFRTKAIGTHRVIVGYWGKKLSGGNRRFAVVSVLHPKGEKSCNFRKRLEKMGVELKPGKVVNLKGVVPLTNPFKKIIINPLSIIKR